MASRREARQWAMQVLFQEDSNPGGAGSALEDLVSDLAADATSKDFASELIDGVITHLEEIDGLITKYARNWDIKRMGRVDRNAMRVALYEMLYRKDIPPVVSINEAVDIAKEFGSGSRSGHFVNGILDQARKQMNRPAREPMKDERGGD